MTSTMFIAIAYAAIFVACVRALDRLLARPPLIELTRHDPSVALQRWRDRYEDALLEETRRAVNAQHNNAA